MNDPFLRVLTKAILFPVGFAHFATYLPQLAATNRKLIGQGFEKFGIVHLSVVRSEENFNASV
jgi:hypothetical protein